MKSKILVVAGSEFVTAVRSKAFIIGIVMLPIFMGGAIAVENYSRRHADTSAREFAVVDETGSLFDVLSRSAAERDRHLVDAEGRVLQPRFVPMQVARLPEETTEAYELRLSEDVRANKLFAYVEFPANTFDGPRGVVVRYHSNTPTYRDLAEWIEATVNAEARSRVIAAAKISPDVVAKLDRTVDVQSLGLAERTAAGGVSAAKEVDTFRTWVVPAIVMMLMFMTVMSAAPQLLNAVLEEKQLRISEVLVGSVTSFELMAGKLLGCVGVASLLAALYFGGGLGVAAHYGVLDRVPFGLLPWFFVFLMLAALIYGSIFISIGAACSDLKDAQSMMTPAMLIVVAPTFVWSVVLKEPNGPLATSFSLFPLFAPVIMPVRIAAPPGPPWWHVALSVGFTVTLAACFVWAAARIFRVGVLMQGKGATYRDMLRWLRAK